ncbi:hypothetical protein D3C87_498830 [compost metagenome]
MGHCINAIILKGAYDPELAKTYDLFGIDLGFDLTFFHISYQYAVYWQYKLGIKGELQTPPKNMHLLFPTEMVLAELAKRISKNTEVQFALIETDYFGGIGDQFASVYTNATLVSNEWHTINQVLKHLGVTRKDGLDEFDTVGLYRIRSKPDELFEDYSDFLEEHNL